MADTPWKWYQKQTGAKAPQAVPTWGTFGGMPLGALAEGADIPGIDPAYQKTWSQIRDQYGFDAYSKIGWGGDTPVEKAEYQFKHGRSGRPSWREGWYNPAFEAIVRAPLRSMLPGDVDPGSGGAFESLVQPGVSPLITTKEAFKGMEVPFNVSDTSYVHKDVLPGISSAGVDLKFAEAAHESVLDALKDREGIAEDIKKEGLLEQRIARSKETSGRLPEYETARAPQATSGMAYSAPAASIAAKLKEENISSLKDIKRDEAGVVKEYEGEMDLIESEREAEELAFAESKSKHFGDISSLLGESKTLLGEYAGMGSNILDAWTQYNVSLPTGGYLQGQGTHTKGGYKGLGTPFAEGVGIGPEVPELGMIADIGEQSMDYSDYLMQQIGAAQETLLRDTEG